MTLSFLKICSILLFLYLGVFNSSAHAQDETDKMSKKELRAAYALTQKLGDSLEKELQESQLTRQRLETDLKAQNAQIEKLLAQAQNLLEKNSQFTETIAQLKQEITALDDVNGLRFQKLLRKVLLENYVLAKTYKAKHFIKSKLEAASGAGLLTLTYLDDNQYFLEDATNSANAVHKIINKTEKIKHRADLIKELLNWRLQV